MCYSLSCWVGLGWRRSGGVSWWYSEVALARVTDFTARFHTKNKRRSRVICAYLGRDGASLQKAVASRKLK